MKKPSYFAKISMSIVLVNFTTNLLSSMVCFSSAALLSFNVKRMNSLSYDLDSFNYPKPSNFSEPFACEFLEVDSSEKYSKII